MKRKTMSAKRNYSFLVRILLIFSMVGIVRPAPRPTAFSTSPPARSSSSLSTAQAETEATIERSSRQDADEIFEMHLPSRPNFQRKPSHRSQDTLKNLFENSRTTQETHKLTSSPTTTTTPDIIPETETIISHGENMLQSRGAGKQGNMNLNYHYFEATTDRHDTAYDVGTTQYIGASSQPTSQSPSLSSNPAEVDSEATTFFIVRTTLPPSRHNTAMPMLHSTSSGSSNNGKNAIIATTTEASKTVPEQLEVPEGVINFEYDNVMRSRNTPMNFHPSSEKPAASPTVSSTESEKALKLSDGEKIGSEPTTVKATTLTTTSATTVEPLLTSTGTINRASEPIQFRAETSPTPFPVLTSEKNSSTTFGAPVVATNSLKFKNKINKGSGVKGANNNPKKKSGLTMMGHDGVKVTRKKQLAEKPYRDDAEIVATTTGAFVSSQVLMKMKENPKDVEPIMIEESTISTAATIAPVTFDSVSTSAGGGDFTRESKTFPIVSTGNPTDASRDESEAENELWNRQDTMKNYLVAPRPSGSKDMDIPTTERPSDNLINATIVNSNESGAALSLSSTISTNTESTETDSNCETVPTSANITEATSTMSSTTPSSASIAPKRTEDDVVSTLATTVELNNSATSSATVEVSMAPSTPTMITQSSALPFSTSSPRPQALYLNETNILVVEITSADNMTEDMLSREDSAYNGNTIPKFTIHNDGISEYDSGNTRPYGTGVEIDYENSKPQADDEIFVPDLKLEPIEDVSSVTVSAKDKAAPFRDTIDRDSDTIFYISNTEVKVVESKPTQNSSPANSEKPSIELSANFDTRRPGSDSQYYPAIYEEDVIIDFPAKNVTYSVGSNQATSPGKDDDGSSKSQLYEEDIILSPLKNNFDPLKIIANRNNNGYEQKRTSVSSDTATGTRHLNPLSLENNPSMMYIGEKLIEVEPSQTDSPITFPESGPDNSEAPLEVNESLVPISDVIIQPAIIPEMSIGVPVIGELPPQIELKEIDFLADSPMTSSLGGSSSSSNNDPSNEKFDGIQYGGDLFARDSSVLTGGAGYDMDMEYVFGGRRHSYDNANGFNPLNGAIKVNRDKNSDNDGNMAPGYDGNNDVTVASKIFMHAVGNLQKDQLIADVRSGFKELPAKHHMNSNGTGAAENLTNATAYSVMEEADGDMFNFTDMQTLFLACFATLVPLILCVLLAFGLRYLWRKYRPGPSVGGLMGDNSTDPLATKSMTMSQDELKSTESGFAINRSNDTLESNDTELDTKTDDRNRLAYRNAVVNEGHDLTPNGMITSTSNHSGANGSVITMTLKNNHLIVETEERNDISRDARETKMHYTPSDKDGVFVVEVARGADSSVIPGSPRNTAESRPLNNTVEVEKAETAPKIDINPTSHEEVQIHQPPRDGEISDNKVTTELKSNDTCTNLSLNSISEPINTNLANSNTGLSQSDLSTSSADSNKGYTYGNQQLYTIEAKECRPVSPRTKASPIKSESDENGLANECVTPVVSKKSVPETKPIITAALLKQDTVNETNDSHSALGQISQDNKPSARQNGVQALDVNNVNIPNITLSHNDTEESMSSNNKSSGPNSLNGQSGDVQHQIGNGEITHVIDNNNGYHNEIKSVDEVHENGMNNGQDTGSVDVNDVENGFDSIISLPPPPPSSDEIKQLNDVILMETNQLDSFPPPPPPVDSQSQILNHEATTNGHSMDGQNGVPMPVAITGSS